MDDNSPQIAYAGRWRLKSNAVAYGGQYHSATLRTASASFTINGTQFTWIAARGRAYGKAQVIVDGTARATVDLCNSTTQWQYNVPITGLTAGTHSVKIKALGTHNAACIGNTIVFDGYSVP